MIREIKIKADAYKVVIEEYKKEKDDLIRTFAQKKKEYYLLEIRKKIEEGIRGSEKLEKVSQEYKGIKKEVGKLEDQIVDLEKVIRCVENDLKGMEKFL